MSDFVIVDGDTLTVSFGATVIPQAQGPQPLSGSSPDFFVKSSPVCRRGDEIPPSLKAPLLYTEGVYTIPGQGTLAVSPKTTTVLKNSGLAVLLKGTQFDATFTVTQAATTPTGAPDPVLAKRGTASFTTGNDVLTAS
jgi:Contractile injection system spike tip protein